MSALLEIRDLEIAFPAPAGEVAVVRGAALEIRRGEIVGLVGESGSGKSLTALAVLGLVPTPGRIRAGSIRFEGRELVGLSERELRPLRGGRIGLVFQEPSAALNPVLTVGTQIVEAIRAHRDLPRRRARERARELLALLAVPDPDRRLDEYPHQLSGGQRQRALVAIALAAGPDLLIADEPTTALDATIQAQILALLCAVTRQRGRALLLITHDFGVVSAVADDVAVMYAGRIVERGPAADVLARPRHPYTTALLRCVPRLRGPRTALPVIPGAPPAPFAWPSGCRYHPRCALASDDARCRNEQPPDVAVGADHVAACWKTEET